jgi:hypothetical protein
LVETVDDRELRDGPQRQLALREVEAMSRLDAELEAAAFLEGVDQIVDAGEVDIAAAYRSRSRPPGQGWDAFLDRVETKRAQRRLAMAVVRRSRSQTCGVSENVRAVEIDEVPGR